MPRLVIAYKPGQLSNRLLQAAAFVAFSQRSGIPVFNPSLDEYADLFEGTFGDLLCRYPPTTSRLPRTRMARRGFYMLAYGAARVLARSGLGGRRLRIVWLDWMEKRLLDESFTREIADAWLVFIQGWRFFLTPAPGAECVGPPGSIEPEADLVRAFLMPREPYRQRAEGLVARARHGCDRLIGVHIRHGDFRTDKNRGRYFYPTERYVQKMKEARAAWPEDRVAFLVCSNEPQAFGLFEGLSCTFASDEPVVEQHALAGCDAIMGPPSSFSMWAAFAGGCPLYWIFDIDERISRDVFRSYAPIDQDEYAERYYGFANAKTGGLSLPTDSSASLRPTTPRPLPVAPMSVVIPLHNEAGSAPRLLLALDRQQRLPTEIVCVNAGSSDDTAAILRSSRIRVPIHVIEEGRLNPGEARNVGVRAAGQEWIAFADGGTEPAVSWISALTELLTAGSDAVFGSYEPVCDSFFRRCAALAYVAARSHRVYAALSLRAWRFGAGLRRDRRLSTHRASEDLVFMERILAGGFQVAYAPDAVVHWETPPTCVRPSAVLHSTRKSI
jgi:hypothetical protein